MKRAQALLKELAAIRRMERGTLCRMRAGPSGAYYNHQTWVDGRNVVRYVPRDQAPALQMALKGYRRFRELSEAYADLIIAHTRQALGSSTPRARTRKPPGRPRKPTTSTND